MGGWEDGCTYAIELTISCRRRLADTAAQRFVAPAESFQFV
jgi:hypothetical protein